MSKVALAHGKTRLETVKKALVLIEDNLAKEIPNKSQIVIKPNFVNVLRSLACTHVDVIRAILDIVTKYTSKQITIAEGSATSTRLGYLRFGYYALRKKYNLRFVDLNRDKSYPVTIYDSRFGPMSVPVAKTILDSDFLISAAILKTHDTVLATLSLKNVLVGSIRGISQKTRIHQGYPPINRTLFEMAKEFAPHLSVIDAFRAMEGNGPSNGTPVDMKLAIAGTDFLAADAVGIFLMGFDLSEIGYLYYCHEAGLGEGDIRKIEILGENPEEHRRRFKRHSSWEEQLNWKIPAN